MRDTPGLLVFWGWWGCACNLFRVATKGCGVAVELSLPPRFSIGDVLLLLVCLLMLFGVGGWAGCGGWLRAGRVGAVCWFLLEAGGWFSRVGGCARF